MAEGGGAAPHPEIWALSRLLGRLGIDNSPAFTLGLAGGAGFLGMGFRYDRDDFSNLHVSGWNPFQSSLVAGVERLGLTSTLMETGSRRKAEKALDVALADGEAVALWVDGAGLGLAPAAYDGMSPTLVVAEGRSADGIELAAAGGGQLVVAPEVLSAARSRIRTHRHRLLTARGLVADLPGAVRGGLASAAVGPVGGPKGNGGPEGIAALADRIDGTGRGSWRLVFAGDHHLLGALVSLHASITREDALLRSPQADYERYAADLLGIPGLLECAAAHEALAAGWQDVADAALPADVPGLAVLRTQPSAFELPALVAGQPFPLTGPETDALLADLAARVTALAAAEHEALELLRDTLRVS